MRLVITTHPHLYPLPVLGFWQEKAFMGIFYNRFSMGELSHIGTDYYANKRPQWGFTEL